MMNMKTMTALSAAGLAVMAGGAQANSTIATIGLTQAGTSFTFDSTSKQLSGVSLGSNPGVTGMQTVKPGATAGSTASDSTPVYFKFGPITETTPVIANAAFFSGGTFSILGTRARRPSSRAPSARPN